MRTAAIIPARGGSRRIKRKNTRNCAGQPLLWWSVEAALRADTIHDVYVSTEDKSIKQLCESWGVDVIDRPKDLASDTADLEDVILHACVTHDWHYDAVVALQPTSPLRGHTYVEEACDMLNSREYNSAISVTQDPGMHFRWSVEPAFFRDTLYCDYDPEARPRTQDLCNWYRENGAIYAMRTDALKVIGCRVIAKTGLVIMPKWQSVDIDEEADLEVASYWLMRQLQRRKPDRMVPGDLVRRAG